MMILRLLVAALLVAGWALLGYGLLNFTAAVVTLMGMGGTALIMVALAGARGRL